MFKKARWENSTCLLMHVNSAARSVCFEEPPPTFVLITVRSNTDVAHTLTSGGRNDIKMSRYDNNSVTSRRHHIYRDKESAFIKQLVEQKAP